MFALNQAEDQQKLPVEKEEEDLVLLYLLSMNPHNILQVMEKVKLENLLKLMRTKELYKLAEIAFEKGNFVQHNSYDVIDGKLIRLDLYERPFFSIQLNVRYLLEEREASGIFLKNLANFLNTSNSNNLEAAIRKRFLKSNRSTQLANLVGDLNRAKEYYTDLKIENNYLLKHFIFDYLVMSQNGFEVFPPNKRDETLRLIRVKNLFIIGSWDIRPFLNMNIKLPAIYEREDFSGHFLLQEEVRRLEEDERLFEEEERMLEEEERMLQDALAGLRGQYDAEARAHGLPGPPLMILRRQARRRQSAHQRGLKGEQDVWLKFEKVFVRANTDQTATIKAVLNAWSRENTKLNHFQCSNFIDKLTPALMGLRTFFIISAGKNKTTEYLHFKEATVNGKKKYALCLFEKWREEESGTITFMDITHCSGCCCPGIICHEKVQRFIEAMIGQPKHPKWKQIDYRRAAAVWSVEAADRKAVPDLEDLGFQILRDLRVTAYKNLELTFGKLEKAKDYDISRTKVYFKNQ